MKKPILILSDDCKASERDAHKLRGEGETVVVCKANVFDVKRDYRGEMIIFHSGPDELRARLEAAGLIQKRQEPAPEEPARRGPGRPPKLLSAEA